MRWRLRARTVDRVWAEGESLYVLLPEVGRQAVNGLVGRLEREAPELLAEVTLRAATFPTDAVTRSALIEALETNPLLTPARTHEHVADDPHLAPAHAGRGAARSPQRDNDR